MLSPPPEWTVLSMLEWATSYFEEKKIRNPRYSIEWLLAHVLDVKRLDLYLLFDRPLAPEELDELRPLVKRRSGHEPLQYITGETDFYNTTIKVKPGVLIPRMETEQLVEIVLEDFPDKTSPLKVLDIGTGSGCIPIALKKHRPAWNISATDISGEALRQAGNNAALNEVNIEWIRDDVFDPVYFPENQQFDIIISNPPYILREEKPALDREVKEFEPELALFCESTEKIYSAILSFSRNHLNKKGSLYLELHEDYGKEVLSLFNSPDWQQKLLPDYDKKERFLKAQKT